ncbi:MAG: tRNA (adenosine(37)-N6)-threonylcarbamoyltransferase complex dimerization subunit type 1 TsaB [Spirochaetaceae bacterium]|nr:tRNA (adenosine(37)-N6)-threonylcarbamoyltransferase complex dimerization subunit type 1 TsaB [Spirochaetaceae bacterium]
MAIDSTAILALDTATEIISTGLVVQGKYFFTQVDAGLSHSELLFQMIDSVLALARLEREEISLILCARGPGSWTGLRIGFSAAQGLAFALRKPYRTIATLDYMALPHAAFHGAVIPALDAKQQRFFCAIYKHGRRISPYLDAEVEELAALCADESNILLTGNAADILHALLSPLCTAQHFVIDPNFRRGRALDLIQCFRDQDSIKAEQENAHSLLYLRKSDAEIQRHGR